MSASRARDTRRTVRRRCAGGFRSLTDAQATRATARRPRLTALLSRRRPSPARSLRRLLEPRRRSRTSSRGSQTRTTCRPSLQTQAAPRHSYLLHARRAPNTKSGKSYSPDQVGAERPRPRKRCSNGPAQSPCRTARRRSTISRRLRTRTDICSMVTAPCSELLPVLKLIEPGRRLQHPGARHRCHRHVRLLCVRCCL